MLRNCAYACGYCGDRGKLEPDTEREAGGEDRTMEGTSTDVDLDPELLTRFSCMATTDRDVLVGELYALLGAQLSREGCEFFLEIGNWLVGQS